MTKLHAHRISSTLELEHWITQRRDRLRCVSFDVFDTLVARCIEPPDAIQRRVATLLAERIKDGRTGQTILALRREIEAELRRAALADGMDHECHYDPLVSEWIARLVGKPDKDLVDFVHTTERRLEMLALTAKPGIPELLRQLHETGLRVIAVSDMYLSHEHVAALLQHCGIGDLIDQIYVSSEFGLGKYSGRLHAKVLELERLDATQVVHIGDNLVSDMQLPLRLGIESVFLDETAERRRRRYQSVSEEMARVGGVWRGRHFFEAVDFRMKTHPSAPISQGTEDFFYRYGAQVLGPAFSVFLLGLIEKVESFQPDRIFFLARDGYLFQEMYQRWRALMPDRNWPQPVYVYASRRVVATASMAEGLSLQQAVVALYNPKQQGLLSILKTFGLPVEHFAALAKEHGLIPLDAPLQDWHDSRLKAFLDDTRVQKLVRPIGLAARERLQRYFDQLGFFTCKRAALVDIGWNGTIQKFLRDSFQSRPDFPDVEGWYFAFVAAMHGDFGMGERIAGLMTDVRNGDPYERTPMDFEEIFEQGARSQEGTTLGYVQTDGNVSPVLKDDTSPDRAGEIACNPLIARFQEGVLAHLEHFHAVWQLTGYTSSDLKPYVQALLERAVAYPSQEEVAEISRLVHTEDFGHDDTLNIENAPIGYLDLLRPRHLYRRLQYRPWKFAAFARFPTMLFSWLFRIGYLVKHR